MRPLFQSIQIAALLLAGSLCPAADDEPLPAMPAELEPAPVPIPPGPFDLQTCFELTVLNSETLGMKQEDIRIAQAQYWQALGGILPKIHLLAAESLRNKTGGGGGGSGVIETSGSGDTQFFGGGGGSRPDSFSSRINVKQPIFSGFREFNAAAAADATIEARTYDKRRTYQLLYLDTADVFYQILMYEGDLRILGEIKKALEERIADLDKRVKLGKSRTGELLMAQSDLADAGVTIEQVRGLLGASRELMAFLTGVPADKLKLKDSQRLPSSAALEGYLRATGERPDILAAMESERAARRTLSAVKGEHWPTISAEGNYYLKDSPERERRWDVFLTFDLPIFEGGIIEARVSEQKALVRQSELSLEQLRRTADRDVRTEYNNFLSAAAQAMRLREAEKVIEANFRAQVEDYKLGIVSNLDVLDALRQWHATRQRLLDAEMQARVNLIRLHVAAGQTPESAPKKPKKKS